MAQALTPDRFCKAGDYLIPLTIGAGESRAEAELKVIITGTYKLEAGTPMRYSRTAE